MVLESCSSGLAYRFRFPRHSNGRPGFLLLETFSACIRKDLGLASIRISQYCEKLKYTYRCLEYGKSSTSRVSHKLDCPTLLSIRLAHIHTNFLCRHKNGCSLDHFFPCHFEKSSSYYERGLAFDTFVLVRGGLFAMGLFVPYHNGGVGLVGVADSLISMAIFSEARSWLSPCSCCLLS